MTLLDSMHNSEQNNETPRPGSRLSAISPEEDISTLLAYITDSPTVDLYEDEGEEEEEADVPESLDALVRNLPTELQPDPAPSEKEPESEDNLNDLSDADDNDDPEGVVASIGMPKKYLLIIAAVLIIVIIAVIISAIAKKKEPVDENVSSNAPTAFYADQLTLTDGVTYQDSMTIEKYIELDQNACLFVFKGYAEQARAFVTAYVDINTYNQYKTGARVPILYEHITINGEDYYMKVRLNL